MALVFLLTGTTSWTVPGDFNNASNTIGSVGPGSNGAARVSLGRGGRGGGGGAFGQSTNVTPSSGSITVAIGAKNSGTNTSFDSGVVVGAAATTSSVVAGLAANCVGNAVTASGGLGGVQATANGVGGGGGGAGGPAGAGAIGQPGGPVGTGASGAGDNGNTAGVAASTAGNNGTQFDASHGIGSGSGGTSVATVFQAGLYGAGGGGNANGTAPANGADGLIAISYVPVASVKNLPPFQRWAA